MGPDLTNLAKVVITNPFSNPPFIQCGGLVNLDSIEITSRMDLGGPKIVG